MKILKYNKSVRDMMKPKSEKEVMTALKNLSPYGVLNMLYTLEEGGYNTDDIREQNEKEIENLLKELDLIFEENKEDKKLNILIDKTIEWMNKYRGDEEDFNRLKIKELGLMIWNDGMYWQHDSLPIYDETAFESYRNLLKSIVVCEIKYNNTDYNL